MIFDTGTRTITLTAKSKTYRDISRELKCGSLKLEIIRAYKAMDVDVLAVMLKHFAALKNIDEAFDIMDEAMESGKKLFDVFAEVAQFAFDMGFFGDLVLQEGETLHTWLLNPLSSIDIDSMLPQLVKGIALDQISGVFKQ